MKKNTKLILLLILVFASRIPFLFAGYGAEEDSWGVALNAMLMERTGIYEYSRIPGHPVQEYLYALLPVKNYWTLNGCTAIMSTLCVWFFYRICKKLNANAFTGLTMLAFTPVFFVNSTNNLDYNWALCFMLASFYFILDKKIVMAAVFVGLAVGCRITSGAILLPLTFYLVSSGCEKKIIWRFVFLSLLACALVFAPVFVRYGKYFFGYVNQFGVPPALKTIFKGTIGVWGIGGVFAIAASFFYALFLAGKFQYSKTVSRVLITCLLTIALFATSYLYEPHKSAYLIPIIPFVILFILLTVKNKKLIYTTACVLLLNCFFMGVNLADDNRSSLQSRFSHVFKLNNQKIAIDFLSGNVLDDFGKRTARMNYAEQIIKKVSGINRNTVIIAGYWLNNILMQQRGRENPYITYVYYVDERTLQHFEQKKFDIFIIQGQQKLNDGCYKSIFTHKYAAVLK